MYNTCYKYCVDMLLYDDNNSLVVVHYNAVFLNLFEDGGSNVFPKVFHDPHSFIFTR